MRRAALVLAVCGVAGSARAQAPADASSPLRLTVSADTVLFPSDERLPIVVRPARPMALVATVTSLSQPSLVVWRSDTVPSGATALLAWDLRTPDGGRLPSGSYVLEVTGRDAAGAAARARRTLVVTQLAADTQPLPRPLAPRDLEPETVEVRQTAPWAIFIGAGAGLLPGMIGRRELNDGRRGDPKAWIVVSTVTVAGFVAFFAGHRHEFSPENATRNVALRRDREERLGAVLEANARARAVAPYRIQSEGTGR